MTIDDDRAALGRKDKPPVEWMTKYGVTERDLEVAVAFINGAQNRRPGDVGDLAEWALAAMLAKLQAEARAPLEAALAAARRQLADAGEQLRKKQAANELLAADAKVAEADRDRWREAALRLASMAREAIEAIDLVPQDPKSFSRVAGMTLPILRGGLKAALADLPDAALIREHGAPTTGDGGGERR